MAQVCSYSLIQRWSLCLSFGLLRNITLIQKILGGITAFFYAVLFRKWHWNGYKKAEQILLVWKALYKPWHLNEFNKIHFWRNLLELVFMPLIWSCLFPYFVMLQNCKWNVGLCGPIVSYNYYLDHFFALIRACICHWITFINVQHHNISIQRFTKTFSGVKFRTLWWPINM